MAYRTKTEARRSHPIRYPARYETLAAGRVELELTSALESRTRQP